MAAENPNDSLIAETLTGDIRDALLTHVRSMETPWSKMPEHAQRDKIYAIENAANSLVSRACSLIASRGFHSVLVQVGKFTVDKGIKIETLASASVDNIGQLAEHGKGAALLVLVEPGEYFGERSPAKPDRDEPELPMGEGGAEEEPHDPKTGELPPAKAQQAQPAAVEA